MKSIVWSQEGPQSSASVFCLVWLVNDCFEGTFQPYVDRVKYLNPTIVREFDTVIRNKLMDLAVLVAFALCVPDENDHLPGHVNGILARYTRLDVREVYP